MNTTEIKRALEAALLCTPEPLSMPQLRKLFDDEYNADLLRPLLDEIALDWAEQPVELVTVASGWRFQSRPEYAVFINRLTPEKAPRYSRAVMETLAIIAYRQPVTRGDIEEIRGVSVSSQIVKTLEERGWIDVVGHKEVPGRPALFGTTKQFLDDLSLRSVQELPPIDEMGDGEAVDFFNQQIDGEDAAQAPATDAAADADESGAQVEAGAETEASAEGEAGAVAEVEADRMADASADAPTDTTGTDTDAADTGFSMAGVGVAALAVAEGDEIAGSADADATDADTNSDAHADVAGSGAMIAADEAAPQAGLEQESEVQIEEPVSDNALAQREQESVERGETAGDVDNPVTALIDEPEGDATADTLFAEVAEVAEGVAGDVTDDAAVEAAAEPEGAGVDALPGETAETTSDAAIAQADGELADGEPGDVDMAGEADGVIDGDMADQARQQVEPMLAADADSVAPFTDSPEPVDTVAMSDTGDIVEHDNSVSAAEAADVVAPMRADGDTEAGHASEPPSGSGESAGAESELSADVDLSVNANPDAPSVSTELDELDELAALSEAVARVDVSAARVAVPPPPDGFSSDNDVVAGGEGAAMEDPELAPQVGFDAIQDALSEAALLTSNESDGDSAAPVTGTEQVQSSASELADANAVADTDSVTDTESETDSERESLANTMESK